MKKEKLPSGPVPKRVVDLTKGIIVPVTKWEVFFAACVGKARQDEAKRLGLRQTAGNVDDYERNVRNHVDGALGELAVAKALGIYWPMFVNTFKSEPDLGRNLEVRWRPAKDYDLKVVPGDVKDRPFILVVGQEPELRVVGWILGLDAQRDEWFHNIYDRRRPKAWWVPQEALLDMGELPHG